MKKLFFICIFVLFSTSIFAQWNNNGDNNSSGNLTLYGRYIELGKVYHNTLSQLYLHLNKTTGAYGEIAFRYANTTDPYIEKCLMLSRYRADGGTLEFCTAPKGATEYHPRLVITSDGKIGIGTSYPNTKLDVLGAIRSTQLDVNGTIRAKEVKIELTGWSDFVFDNNYRLPSLKEVESYINRHNHLPNIPSEKEVLENGIDVGEMQAKLLQKIEELTLYMIEQQKEIKDLQEENKKINKELDNLRISNY
ncbi:hypothetical protein [Dysgonomonas sp. 25]|uniref:hypothetical protein n=1 Tax=Dysgonomonas sp. 25 TaxID=2302933 RepID=UPI0013D8DDF5|nr:hypothetical protein [Dysgonomonas sp. 25]NDV68102.1 hypothetical protein [Dysgonomonas sp. 25]